MTTQQNPPSSPINRYSGELFANLVIQVIAEQGSDEQIWDALNSPAVPYAQAAQLAPALPDQIAQAIENHKISGNLHDRILSEM